MGTRDLRVDAYIEKAANFAQPILRHLRDVVHTAAPGVEETMKWSFPHFTRRGILCSMAAFNEHCTFGFWKGSLILPREDGAATQAMGQFGRITSIADLPPRAVLIGYVREAVRLNEADVRVARRPSPKPDADLSVPAAFRKALEANPVAAAAFDRFSPSHRREYVEWIAEAKRDETRERRINTAIEWIGQGKQRHWKYVKREA